VVYEALRLDVTPPDEAKRFAERAAMQKLGLYIGAGVSHADPTGLPLGRKLYELAIPAARRQFPHAFENGEDAPTSLESLGSRLGDENRAQLHALLLRLDEFTRASPNYAHRALALLLLLQLVTVMSANWDTCIERAATEMGGRIEPTVTEDDRRQQTWAQRMHKIHGCAERPESLQVSTEDLAQPPDWVNSAVSADLGSESIVFVGLGTVGDYVATRIKQLLDRSSPRLGDIAVVSYNGELSADWDQLLPADDRNVIHASADRFLDDLLRAIAMEALARAYERIGQADDPRWVEQLDALLDEFREIDALSLLRWWTDGAEPDLRGGALFDATASMQLLAVARLAKERVALSRPDGVMAVELRDTYVEVARVAGRSGEAFRRREEGRLQRRVFLRRGKPVLVLYSGETMTPVPRVVRDVVDGEPDQFSVVEGAQGPVLMMRRVEDVLHEGST
jgi:SIR2-like domain